jgi:hypothetical protein
MTQTTRPIIRIHDSASNEIIDREMNDAEYAAHQESILLDAQNKQAQAEKVAAKAALLERLGITEDEAALLLA